MTDPTSDPSPAADTWEGMLDAMRRRYPGQKDSVLFCVHKLLQDPDLTLRDFREEARLHGIPMAGRALHSARVLLGLQAASPAPKRGRAARADDDASDDDARDDAPPPRTVHGRAITDAPAGRVRRPRRAGGADQGPSIESQVLDAVRKIQSAAGEDATRLRQAIRRAVQILQDALDD
ncbi:MAG: hypothetical protein H6835_11950 [Planctomycetes bacterium]|nr:hypothetical protein [Planctomycetota bacterium]